MMNKTDADTKGKHISQHFNRSMQLLSSRKNSSNKFTGYSIKQPFISYIHYPPEILESHHENRLKVSHIKLAY